MNSILIFQIVLFLLVLLIQTLDASEPELFESKRRDTAAEDHHRINNNNNNDNTIEDNRVATEPKLSAAATTTDSNNNNNNDHRRKSVAENFVSSPKSADIQHYDLSNVDLSVLQMTSRKFSSSISDGSIWLVEFYSLGCIHCQEFAHTYSDIAAHYHTKNYEQLQQQQSSSPASSSKKTTKRKTKPPRTVKVAKVNGPSERSLVSRFGVYGYPQIFLVDGWSVYEYTGTSRTKEAMVKYVDGGYLKTKPIPIYESPFGPIGLLQGTGINVVYTLEDIISYAQTKFGFAPMVTGMILFGSVFILCFIGIVLLAVLIPPSDHYKHD